MESKVCSCGKVFTEAQSSGDTCFRCKVKSIRFGFTGGGSYGRQAFHDKTIAEAQREQVEGAKRAGINIEKVPERAELI